MKTINDFLQELNDSNNSDLDLAYYYNEGDDFEQYQEAIQEGIYENEIIYYSKAIDYLQKNDPSLQESMNIASEYGYTTENINSELLATLLYQQELNEEFSNYYSEIETYFEEYEEFKQELQRFAEFTQEFNEIQKMKMFEIQVIDTRISETDYITFDISIEKNTLKAQHVALTQVEEDSNLIAFKSVDIDTDFSLDENLSELLTECNEAICNSDFYTLAD